MLDTRRCVGAVLLACGLAFLVSSSGAFTDAVADRTSTIDVANDPDAYLGIVDNSADVGSGVGGGNDTGNIYFLDDNADAFGDASAFSAAVVRVDYDDGTTDADPGLDATVRDTDAAGLTTNRDYILQLECEDGAADQGTGYVTVAIAATGDDVVDAERRTNQRLTIDCT